MTCRWLICFSIAAGPALTATVQGTVSLTDSRAPEVVKKKSRGGVVVWLEPAQGTAPLQAGEHKIIQKGKRFVPHVSVVSIGTTVDLPNLDPIFHNAFSNFAGQPFDTGLYPPGGTRKVRFQREGVVRVFCNIHSTMSAVIVVVKSPWSATSESSGAYRLDGVPPGDYVLKFWHERATPDTLRALERRVTVGASGLEIPPIDISERGFVVLPHDNKYGKPYGPEPPNHNSYEMGRR